jgi:hypothetical protein
MVALMTNYGSHGVLYRKDLKQALQARLVRVEELIEKSEDATGWVKYEKGVYSLVPGHFLTATMFSSDSKLTPGGNAEIMVQAYSNRVDKVRIELQYEDGNALDACMLGNMAQAAITQGGLAKWSERTLYWSRSISIPLQK